MLHSRKFISLGALLLLIVSCNSKKKDNQKLINSKTYPKEVVAKLPHQNPEGIEFDKNKNVFLISAINDNPNIASVDLTGESSQFSNNQKSSPGSSFGLQVDYNGNRLLACTNNLESGAVAIYNLDTGEIKHLVNLSKLLPVGIEHQANDLVVGADNIYVTGRLENSIYKINKALEPSILLQREGLERPNGIVYSEKGYLIVAYYTNTTAHLVKIPVNDPESAKIIKINNFEFRGLDGMILTEAGNLIGVAKNFDDPKKGYVLEFSSEDEWQSASLVNKIDVKRSTTIAQVEKGKYYVLNQDWKTPDAVHWTFEYVEIKKGRLSSNP